MSSTLTSPQTSQAMGEGLSKIFQASKERLRTSENLLSTAREYYVDQERLASFKQSHKRAQEQYTADRTRLQTFLNERTSSMSQELRKRPAHFTWDHHRALVSVHRAAEDLAGEKWPDGCCSTSVASTANIKPT